MKGRGRKLAARKTLFNGKVRNQHFFGLVCLDHFLLVMKKTRKEQKGMQKMKKINTERRIWKDNRKKWKQPLNWNGHGTKLIASKYVTREIAKRTLFRPGLVLGSSWKQMERGGYEWKERKGHGTKLKET